MRPWYVAFLCRNGTKMPNVFIAAYVYPGRCPGLGATIGLFIMSAALGNLSKLNCPRLHDISARYNYLPMRRMGRKFEKRPYLRRHLS